MRIYLITSICCLLLIFSCSGDERQKNDKNDEILNKPEVVISETQSQNTVFNLDLLKGLNPGDEDKINGLVLDEESISGFIVRSYLTGDDYSILIDLISYQDIIVLLVSSSDFNNNNQIINSVIIKKELDTWEISHKLTKKTGKFREDIIVIVDGSGDQNIVASYLIDLDKLQFESIDYSDIELVQEES